MIIRDVNVAARTEHDLVIVGGGIYGACMLLQAAQMGVRAVLVEQADFGGATSWNSLRIIHGGLRYLQRFDLKRYYDAVAERRWFLQTFPDLVEPLPCVMPLYGDGLRRPAVLRAALAINELLGASCGIQHERWERGRMLNTLEAITLAPYISLHGLRGAAMWFDGSMSSSQRVVIEILKWACSLGNHALNYVQAEQLLTHRGRVTSVRARDRLTGRILEFHAPAVVNCAGPWSAQVAAAFDRNVPGLFRPSLAFNVLLDRPPKMSCALAVAPRANGASSGPTYFLTPLHGRLLAGTFHVPWHDEQEHPRPTHRQVGQMLQDLNAAVPGLGVDHEDVLRVYSGMLPARKGGSRVASTRPVIRDHAKFGGPRGLVSVSGVKFTTARRVAEQALRRLFPQACAMGQDADGPRPPQSHSLDLLNPQGLFCHDDAWLGDEIHRIVRDEAVTCVDDLLLRRTDWLSDPREAERVTHRICSLAPALAGEPTKRADRSGELQRQSPARAHL